MIPPVVSAAIAVQRRDDLPRRVMEFEQRAAGFPGLLDNWRRLQRARVRCACGSSPRIKDWPKHRRRGHSL